MCISSFSGSSCVFHQTSSLHHFHIRLNSLDPTQLIFKTQNKPGPFPIGSPFPKLILTNGTCMQNPCKSSFKNQPSPFQSILLSFPYLYEMDFIFFLELPFICLLQVKSKRICIWDLEAPSSSTLPSISSLTSIIFHLISSIDKVFTQASLP